MSSINLRLKPGEKLYINGAVIKVDRRVSIEVLNDVSFLLEAHILQASDATTPLRQLYFVVQSALMDPVNSGSIKDMVREMTARTIISCDNREIQFALVEAGELTDRGRYFEALRLIRRLYPLEAAILGKPEDPNCEAA